MSKCSLLSRLSNLLARGYGVKPEPVMEKAAEEKPPTQEQVVAGYLRELIRNGKYTFIDRDEISDGEGEDDPDGLVISLSVSYIDPHLSYYLTLNGQYLTQTYLTQTELNQLWRKHRAEASARRRQEDADRVKKELEKCLPCSALLR